MKVINKFTIQNQRYLPIENMRIFEKRKGRLLFGL